MHRYKARIKRYRVQTRPKVRSRRRLEVVAVLSVLVLGAGAALTAPRLLRHLPRPSELSARLYPRSFVLVGAPEVLAAAFSETLESAPGGPAARASELKSRHQIVRSVRVSRDWLARRVRFKVELRRPMARLAQDGKARGFLAADGELFTAPEGLFTEALPEVEVGGADRVERRRLAACISDLVASGGLPSALARMSWAPRLDGWEIRLEDGTTVLWGDLRWTGEKALRLKQVLEDARGADAGALTADLRYFEDGKIFVRPSLQASL
ncbi:MAG: cell division protein FtsQ [Elusimicrobia bacterium]|nr:cell division protein FtsQ [Elusimicrobiota bacterium]